MTPALFRFTQNRIPTVSPAFRSLLCETGQWGLPFHKKQFKSLQSNRSKTERGLLWAPVTSSSTSKQELNMFYGEEQGEMTSTHSTFKTSRGLELLGPRPYSSVRPGSHSDVLSAVKALCVAVHCLRAAKVNVALYGCNSTKGFFVTRWLANLLTGCFSSSALAGCLSPCTDWSAAFHRSTCIHVCQAGVFFLEILSGTCLGWVVTPHRSAQWNGTLFCWCCAGQGRCAVTQTLNMRWKQRAFRTQYSWMWIVAW